MAIKHAWQSPHSQGPDPNQLGPNQWNADHKFDVSVAFPTTGAGAALTNVGASYDAVAVSQNLGFVEIYMDGIDTIEMTVKANKIGTGTQSWQLWNETNAAEVGVINDAGGTGQKYLTGTFTGLALTGKKRLRIRAKSTVAGDDPTYHGSSLVLRKTT